MRSLISAPDAANLELTPAEMLAMGQSVVARSVEHIAALADQPSCGDVDIAELCRSLRESAPENGAELEPLLDLLYNELIPRSFTTPGPGYLAYIPGGGLYPAALADFIADVGQRLASARAALARGDLAAGGRDAHAIVTAAADRDLSRPPRRGAAARR